MISSKVYFVPSASRVRLFFFGPGVFGFEEVEGAIDDLGGIAGVAEVDLALDALFGLGVEGERHGWIICGCADDESEE